MNIIMKHYEHEKEDHRDVISDLVSKIKDDVKDIAMLVKKATFAYDSREYEIAKSYINEVRMRKASFGASHAMMVMLLEEKNDERTEHEKIFHKCLHEVLIEDLDEAENELDELMHKM